MTIRHQNLDPDRERRETVHARALETQRQPRTYNQILSDLIASHEGTLDDDALAQYAADAETLARHEPPAPPKQTAAPTRTPADLDSRIAELRAQAGKGSERQRFARTAELERLLAERYPRDRDGFYLPDDDGGAAA
ncbi:MAG TPA: hypothetical protein VFR23_26165 [Jiangellaceae bacterium]|nr:hypothetical protein [Jiangellaceae bacterium]